MDHVNGPKDKIQIWAYVNVVYSFEPNLSTRKGNKVMDQHLIYKSLI